MEKRVMTGSKRRKGLMAASALLGGVLVLTACNDGDASGSSADSSKKSQAAEVDKAAAQDASDAQISIAPKNGATNASINNDAKVTVAKGTLSEVTMTTSAGAPVKGSLAADGTSWQPDVQLERSTTYKISATAKDSKGREAHENGSFTTVSPANSFIGNFTPEDGSTVGVGMPVSINFNKPITDKKAVQDGITVTSSSGQEVVGHWFNPQRLDLRPESYWQGGSTVTLKLALDGVEGANGVFGVQQKTVTFKVGRNQVSTVDANTKTMTVTQNGKTIKTIPISSGSSANPTYNGQMVISEKFKETRMNGATVGFTDGDGKGEYDIKDVPHAMRLSTSGTFIHGNYWGARSIFGSANTSHGCVGLPDVKGAGDANQPAAWFYNNSLVGDVVIVKNSPDRTITPDNGLNGWNMSWADWKAGSQA
ncbi:MULTISPECIES: L,D-transpeptidase [unclassified Streptomyces]|uniref:L,D-transpeptidase n=1 Tax=unclassified Streptomyces TaxID=2593676 RepID=UPI00224D027E|nr:MULTISPECIES: Ig-like domain-containing protein [unclassified Streptomyces]WSP57117.1 Ig-like domain-containing protein [Streptomyces sp. NBC_01241]WSU22164.1 Ig-like domain-containing protein [Streptomyces sp. NBC_01108]MCX4788921.1 Ig-like domain-containing protein [Streptomyces sp. NBC_01221]MCX4795332.1 Ig-like domain-containing protein [Streptomyces sp. NBC_01242]WSJ36637.1 Ig-like domain-containing protein [Streptomyces sp. NBC_01321]